MFRPCCLVCLITLIKLDCPISESDTVIVGYLRWRGRIVIADVLFFFLILFYTFPQNFALEKCSRGKTWKYTYKEFKKRLSACFHNYGNTAMQTDWRSWVLHLWKIVEKEETLNGKEHMTVDNSSSSEWSSYLRRDIDCREKIQRRTTLQNNPSGFWKLACTWSWTQATRNDYLTSLETRRQRGDLLLGKERVNTNCFFTLYKNLHCTRGTN